MQLDVCSEVCRGEGNIEIGKDLEKSWSKVSDCLVCLFRGYLDLRSRRSNKLAVKGLKTPWKKRQLERLEKKAVKEYEQQLKEASKREKEVRKIGKCASRN